MGQLTGIIPHQAPTADRPAAKPKPDATEPAQSAPTPDDDSALKASRTAFSNICEDEVRGQLSMPASFDLSYFLSGPPHLVNWPDHATSWTSTLAFKASNAYGAVGRYQAVCTQDLEGKVIARISLER